MSMFLCLCLYISVCVFVCVFVYICISVSVHVYECLCACICEHAQVPMEVRKDISDPLELELHICEPPSMSFKTHT